MMDEANIVAADSLGLEPHPESLWWRSMCSHECEADMNLTVMDKIFTFPFWERAVTRGHA